jgi:hypothetical protein
MATAGTPIPADWALTWVWYHQGTHVTTAQNRCPKEFETLFRQRYTAAKKDGIVLRPGKR